MRFKTDENLPEELASLLRHSGYDALSVNAEDLSGASDASLIGICEAENRILVTLDTDFADIRRYAPREYKGIIVLRLVRQDKLHVLKVMGRLLEMLTREEIAHRLWIVDERQVRIRS